METNTLRVEIKASGTLTELKGIENIIPKQSIPINVVVLKESKESSEIKNVVTTKDELYGVVLETVKKLILLQKKSCSIWKFYMRTSHLNCKSFRSWTAKSRYLHKLEDIGILKYIKV